ncbi:TatD family hydrolase [Candidatus Margulisiibacteriota bacterium]
MIIDTHAHLHFDDYSGQVNQVVEQALKGGVEAIVNVGIDLDDNKKAIKLAERFENVYAAVGNHPHGAADDIDESVFDEIKKLSDHDKVKAIGEIGYDFYKSEFAEESQTKMFSRMLDIAVDVKLPVIVHSREAEGETLTLLSEYEKKVRGVVHCFSGSLMFAQALLDMGYLISFTGVATFKNATGIRDIIKEIPLEKIMVETDCPYLAPDPYRGKRNEPAYVTYIAEKIAQVKGVSFDEVCRVTTATAREFFNL